MYNVEAQRVEHFKASGHCGLKAAYEDPKIGVMTQTESVRNKQRLRNSLLISTYATFSPQPYAGQYHSAMRASALIQYGQVLASCAEATVPKEHGYMSCSLSNLVQHPANVERSWRSR